MPDTSAPALSSNCSAQRTLELVGDRWAILVLRDIFSGLRRFDDLQRHLGIARNVLTARLNQLVERDILAKVAYREPGQRERSEYRLTDMGRDLYPVVAALIAFGDKHLAGDDGPPVLLQHRDCGASVQVHLTCDEGHTLDSVRDVKPRRGPGW